MRNDKQKDIKKPIFLKNLILYAAAGTAALQFAACNEISEKKEVKENSEVQLYDASDLNIEYVLSEYNINYQIKNIKGAKQKYDQYSELYEKLHSEENTADSELKELYIDMTADQDSVKFKTNQGYLTIKEQEQSYVITNENIGTDTEIMFQYNIDGSWNVSEQNMSEDSVQSYVFTSNGMLQESKDKQHNTLIYKNGNINCYDQFNSKNELIKQQNSDGSYILYTHGIDDNIYDITGSLGKSYFDSVVIYYDNSDIFNHAEISDESKLGDNTIRTEKRKIFADGLSYEYQVDRDMSGNVIRTYKEERKKGEYYQLVEEDNGKTIVKKYDYIKDDMVYEKINDVVLRELKNDIIYVYSHDNGEFDKAYKVCGNGIEYYDKDGVIVKFEDTEKNKEINYEDGKIKSIYGEEKNIIYTNYEENLVYAISNKTENEIEVEANGVKYKLGERGYCNFDENGNCTLYKYNDDIEMLIVPKNAHVQYANGQITAYDDQNKIIETSTADEQIRYYDYENNKIQFKRENNILCTYYENQLLKSVQNENVKDSDIIVTVNDQNGNEYDLAGWDSVQFYESGNIQNVKQGDIEKHFFIDGNTDYYKEFTGSDDSFKCGIYYKNQCLQEADYVISISKIRINEGPIEYKIGNQKIINLENEEGKQVYIDSNYKNQSEEER